MFVEPVVNLNFTSQLKFSISYHFETVSFPFIVECSFSGTGDCTQATPCSTHTRNLQLPQEDASHFTYIPNDHCFQYQYLVNNSATDKFYLKTPEYNVLGPFSSGNMGPPPHNAHTLASAGFIRTTGLGFSRNVIPHSIIKPVIKIHCGEDETYPVISEISFYYDNTRGRMRYYPFNECNEDFNTSPSEYDVIFAPEYLIGSDIYYNTFDTDILEDGTLNYYPFSEITPTAGCNSNILPDINSSLYNPYFLRDYYINNYPNPVTRANVMYGDIYNNSTNIFPNPYTLFSSPLRNSSGKVLAGYELNGSSIVTKPGIHHSYFIDQNTDLTIINPSEREIYNPSEATITANNLVFPENYTFRTIRGVYPSPAEVAAAQIPENGYDANTDPRLVCAVTDLTSENPDDAINFPLSAQPATKHLYASRYYMENGSKLTIQNCVRLFDCTFDVKQGATLVFDDYPTHFGKEDHSFINDRGITRFKIQTLGGAVLRNFADVQYLQNGDITQTIPLHYKAMYEIYAGRSVDPDTDVPQQDYIIRSGADVTMQAGTAIYLEDGFTAEYGSNVTIDPLPIGSSAAPC